MADWSEWRAAGSGSTCNRQGRLQGHRGEGACNRGKDVYRSIGGSEGGIQQMQGSRQGRGG